MGNRDLDKEGVIPNVCCCVARVTGRWSAVSPGWSGWPHVYLAMESGQLIFCQGHREVSRLNNPNDLLKQVFVLLGW